MPGSDKVPVRGYLIRITRYHMTASSACIKEDASRLLAQIKACGPECRGDV
jgi:hypothetical protein